MQGVAFNHLCCGRYSKFVECVQHIDINELFRDENDLVISSRSFFYRSLRPRNNHRGQLQCVHYMIDHCRPVITSRDTNILAVVSEFLDTSLLVKLMEHGASRLVDPYEIVCVLLSQNYIERCKTLLRSNAVISRHWQDALYQNKDNGMTRGRAKWFTAQLQQERARIKSALVFAGLCKKHKLLNKDMRRTVTKIMWLMRFDDEEGLGRTSENP